MALTAISASPERDARILTPGYFFSNAAVTGRTSWLMIWVVYQVTSPSFLAASITLASMAWAEPAMSDPARASIEVRKAINTSPLRAGLLDLRFVGCRLTIADLSNGGLEQ